MKYFTALSPLIWQTPILINDPTPDITLDNYGSFSGLKISKSLTGHPLLVAVDAWLGIDYATQPVGERRFRPVEKRPAAFEGTKTATEYGTVCIQDPGTYAGKTGYEQNEACLNFNVYRTAGVSLSEATHYGVNS